MRKNNVNTKDRSKNENKGKRVCVADNPKQGKRKRSEEEVEQIKKKGKLLFGLVAHV